MTQHNVENKLNEIHRPCKANQMAVWARHIHWRERSLSANLIWKKLQNSIQLHEVVMRFIFLTSHSQKKNLLILSLEYCTYILNLCPRVLPWLNVNISDASMRVYPKQFIAWRLNHEKSHRTSTDSKLSIACCCM